MSKSRGSKEARKKHTGQYVVRVATIKKLEHLEKLGLILDWDYEGTTGETVYFMTLLNGVEVSMFAGPVSGFYLGCVSAYAKTTENNDLFTQNAVKPFLKKSEEIQETHQP